MRPPRFQRWLALLTAVTAFGALCPDARAEEPTRPVRIDPDAYPPPSAQGRLLLTGAVMTGAFYGAAVGASYFWPDSPGAADLRIPVVGPWMKVFQTGCSDTNPNCNKVFMVIGAVLAGLDGLGQAGGLGLLLEGIFLETRAPRTTAFTEPTRVPSDPLVSRRSFYPVPLLTGDDGIGLGVVGTF